MDDLILSLGSALEHCLLEGTFTTCELQFGVILSGDSETNPKLYINHF